MGSSQAIGTVLGGVGGFMLGGPAGAMAGASLGGSLGGGLDGQSATGSAVRAQGQATKDANQVSRDMYEQQMRYTDPWVQAGQRALGEMQRPLTMEDLQADPSYQFRMQEGMKAITNSAPSMNSGRHMKDLMRYGQNFASQEWQNAHNRRMQTLGTLAGYGHSSTGQMLGAAQNYGNQVSNNLIGYGNAQAAAQMGNHQSNMNLLGDLAGAGAMYFGGGGSK